MLVAPIPPFLQQAPDNPQGLQMVAIDGGPHAIPWTHADQVSSALLKFMA